MKKRLTVLCIALSLGMPGLAAEVGGIKLDDKVSLGGQELLLNGAGIRTRLVFKVYVASLYLPRKAGDPAAVLAQVPRRIQLNVLRKLTAEQLVDALLDGLQANNGADELQAVKPQTDQLVSTMKAFNELREKDLVALDFVDGSTRISFNGEQRGVIGGERFNRALTRVWLGDKPVQADLKNALLGA